MIEQQNILVKATGRDAQNVQGNVFEDFISKFMVNEGFEVRKRVKINNIEIDLMCHRNLDDLYCIVECKSTSSPLGSPEIRRFIGTAACIDCTEARIYSASRLSSNAGPINSTELQVTFKLVVIGPTDIIKQAINQRVLYNPITAQAGLFEQPITEDCQLLLTEKGVFWILKLRNAKGMRSCIAINADALIKSEMIRGELLDWLGELTLPTEIDLIDPDEFSDAVVRGADPESLSLPSDTKSAIMRHLKERDLSASADKVANFLRDVVSVESDTDRIVEQLKLRNDAINLMRKARSAIGRLELDKAELFIELSERSQVEEVLSTGLESLAELRLLRGRVHLLNQSIESASAVFLSGAQMLSPFDVRRSGIFVSRCGRELFFHGRRYGGPALFESVTMYEKGLRILKCRNYPNEWAKTKRYKSEAFRLLGRRNANSKGQFWLDRALKDCEAARKIFNRTGNKLELGKTIVNLSLILCYKGRFNDVSKGIPYLEDARENLNTILRSEKALLSDANIRRVHHYLGDIYGEWGMRIESEEGLALLDKAEKHYKCALSGASDDWESERIASTQNNLANLLIAKSLRPNDDDAESHLLRAESLCEDALKIRERPLYPLDWAQTKTNLAWVYLLLARLPQSDGHQLLDAAFAECEAAGDVRTPDEVPVDWVETELLRGEIAEEKYRAGGGSRKDFLDSAKLSYRKCIELLDQENIPFYTQKAKERLDGITQRVDSETG